MRIILVRHSETYGNIGQKFNGITESPLTERGKVMQKQVLERLNDINKVFPIDKVFSSPSKRALDAAEIFSKTHNVDLEVVEELIEYNFGIFDGLSFIEAREIDSDLLDNWLKNSIEMALPNGESFRDKTNRVSKWLDSLLEEEYDTVIIFTHGATFRSILMELLELPLEQAWHFNVGLGSFCIINYENGFGVLEEFINPDFKF